jgi:HSP20 family molecular chaperone IbpA
MNKQMVQVNGLQNRTNERLSQRVNQALDSIRERAYSLSQLRGGSPEESDEDWTRAERELFQIPESKVSERDSLYNLQVAVPGFAANQLAIATEPKAVTIYGTAEHGTHKLDGSSQLESKQLFRRFEFTSMIETDQVKATVENGVLNIAIPKANLAGAGDGAMQPAAEQGAAHAA